MVESFELVLPRRHDNEAEQVARAKRRDAATWTDWYQRYFPLLFRYALARTGRREEAEDIASQAFMRALEGIDRFDYRGKAVLAWLYRITHNLIADRARRHGRRPQVRLDDVDLAFQGAGLDLPRLEVMDALTRLRDDQREVLILRFLVSLPARDVAAILQKSETAIYSLQVRAMANLRRALAE